MGRRGIINCLTVVLLCFAMPSTAVITDIRLVDGSSPNEGRLEVLDPALGWGTVCYIGWDIMDTEVVCRVLGFPGANSHLSANSPFGQSTASILINNVDCNGTEGALNDCTFNEVTTGCSHERDVGVICHKPGYIGCFGDSFDRLFKAASYSDPVGMTIDACLTFCRGQDLQYAGLEYASECYCAATGAQYDAQGTYGDSECNFICIGNIVERCGGNQRISVFDTTVGFCEDPGEPTYGTRQGDWFRYGASVTFDCAEGYNLTGNQSIQCLSADGSPSVNWNANTPICLGPTDIPTTSGPSTVDPTTENAFTTGFFTTKVTNAPTTNEIHTPLTTDGTGSTAVATTSIDQTTSLSPTTMDTERTTNAGPTTDSSTTNMIQTTQESDTTTYTTTSLVTTVTESLTTDALTTVTVIVDVTTSSSENSFTSTVDTTSSFTNPSMTSDVSSTDLAMTTTILKTEIPPTTITAPEDITGTLATEVITSDTTTGMPNMTTSPVEVDTTGTPLVSTQATPTIPPTTDNSTTPEAGAQESRWPWPPVGIGLLLGGIILGLLLIVLVICLVVIGPRAKAKKEEEEAVRLRNARQSPVGDSYSPDIVLDRNGRRSYRSNGVQRLDESEIYDNGAFLADDASIIGVYGERQRAVENPYATFPSDDTSKKILFADTARKLNQIYVPRSPNGSNYSRGTGRSSSDRYGAQLVV